MGAGVSTRQRVGSQYPELAVKIINKQSACTELIN